MRFTPAAWEGRPPRRITFAPAARARPAMARLVTINTGVVLTGPCHLPA